MKMMALLLLLVTAGFSTDVFARTQVIHNSSFVQPAGKSSCRSGTVDGSTVVVATRGSTCPVKCRVQNDHYIYNGPTLVGGQYVCTARWVNGQAATQVKEEASTEE